jgi:hypothetical protein
MAIPFNIETLAYCSLLDIVGSILTFIIYRCPIWYQLFLPIESWFAKALNFIALVV